MSYDNANIESDGVCVMNIMREEEATTPNRLFSAQFLFEMKIVSITAYKAPGDKEWRFVESELIEVVRENRSASRFQSFEEMEAMLRKGTRHRDKN